MAIIITIIIIVLALIIIVLAVKHAIFCKNIINNFKSCNVITYGKKGTGKDLLTQWVINQRKNEEYYANLSYGNKYNNVQLKAVSVEPNTYETIVNNVITLGEHKFYEKADIYISDVGIYLPSYMDSILYKKYPSLPIFYALSRHLYECNIHCNCQNLGRVWKALREQADFYINTKKTFKFFGFLIIKCVTYDKYESAQKNLLPLKTRLFNKYSKAQYDLYASQNGDIKSGHIIIRKKDIKYNTRAFEQILLKGERKYPPNYKLPRVKI